MNVGPVVVDGPEGDAVVGELREVAVAEHLEPAGVSQDGTVPLHEVVKAAHLGDKVGTRPVGKVVGVGQKDLGPELLELSGKDALDRCLGPDGHEDGRGNVAVRRVEHAGTRMRGRVFCNYVVGEPQVAGVLVLAHLSYS